MCLIVLPILLDHSKSYIFVLNCIKRCQFEHNILSFKSSTLKLNKVANIHIYTQIQLFYIYVYVKHIQLNISTFWTADNALLCCNFVHGCHYFYNYSNFLINFHTDI